jgi:site-specific DNA-methyltransferase (adenine-specific)/adenine-specific DNA-methyltransferase
MDELFGAQKFVATVIWQKVYSPKNSARHFSEDHDFVVVYARNGSDWKPRLIPRSEEQDEAYKNPDNDPRGPWKTSDLSARNFYSLGTYSIATPSGRVIAAPPKGRYWVVSNEKLNSMISENRIWWGRKGDSIPQQKRFLTDVKQGRVPQTLWKYEEVGHTQEAKQELVAVCDFVDSLSVFITPKPVRLMTRVFEIAADSTSLILDSFAGSGTTGHAVLQMNKADGGNRRFILVEMDENIAKNVTAQRLTKVVDGYTNAKGEAVPALGGGFRYCTLGRPLFDEFGQIDREVSFSDLAAHVFFTETGSPLPKRADGHSPLLGTFDGRAIYLLFNGILGDKRPAGGNILTARVLEQLPPHAGPRIIYGEGCRLGKARLLKAQVTFKQMPYDVKTG